MKHLIRSATRATMRLCFLPLLIQSIAITGAIRTLNTTGLSTRSDWAKRTTSTAGRGWCCTSSSRSNPVGATTPKQGSGLSVRYQIEPHPAPYPPPLKSPMRYRMRFHIAPHPIPHRLGMRYRIEPHPIPQLIPHPEPHPEPHPIPI